LNVAQLLVKCLENEGVRHVFGIPGEETLALNAALADSDKIKFVLTRHEQGAAFMADVYGRLSSYPGVCLATLGPGATNLITGVADAHIDRAPLVAITGQVGLERSHKESHQYVDIVRQVIAPVRRAGGCFGRRDEQGDKLWGEAGLFGESVRGQAVLLVGTGLGRGHSRNRVKPEPRRARSMRHCGPPMGGTTSANG